MSDMPERIWAKLVGHSHPWFESIGEGLTEYVRADKAAELEAMLLEIVGAEKDLTNFNRLHDAIAHARAALTEEQT
ncbi:hypothetical protein OAA60_00810 [Porticoccaceae bacterium]|nr:hypothetical protein [Porticoccaceae bacterium]